MPLSLEPAILQEWLAPFNLTLETSYRFAIPFTDGDYYGFLPPKKPN